MKDLQVDGNELTQLDLSDNINLVTLCCQNNNITSLDLTNNRNLKGLRCEDNNLTVIKLGKCYDLEWLSCGGNNLTSLDLSNQFVLRPDSDINIQLQSAKCLKTYNGWAVDIGALVGQENIGRVQLEKGWGLTPKGYATYKGNEMPETLYYSYNTQYTGALS